MALVKMIMPVWLVATFLLYDINKINGEYFFQKLNQQHFNDLPNVMNNIVRVIIASLNEKFLTEIVDVMNDRLNKGI